MSRGRGSRSIILVLAASLLLGLHGATSTGQVKADGPAATGQNGSEERVQAASGNGWAECQTVRTMLLLQSKPAISSDTGVSDPEKPAAAPAVQQKTERSQEKPVQKLSYPINAANRQKPAVSVTFDDGFSKSAVQQTLKVLKQEKITATFFIIGTVLTEYPDLWKQAVKDGHQVCNHTGNHQFLGTLSKEKAGKAIRNWETAAVKVLGQSYVTQMKKDFPYLRLPGGSGAKSKSLMQLVADCGYIPIGWDVETCYSVLRHYNLKKCDLKPVRERIVRYVVTNTRNGSIVLLHFNNYDIPRLEDILKGIREKGLQMRTISELLPKGTPGEKLQTTG